MPDSVLYEYPPLWLIAIAAAVLLILVYRELTKEEDE